MVKTKEKYDHWFPPLIGAGAVTLGRTVLYACSNYEVPDWMRRHELKHVEQIEKLGVICFYGVYFFQYILGRFKGMSHWDAYYVIGFEVEAREAEKR
jgi:hypothetical protein